MKHKIMAILTGDTNVYQNRHARINGIIPIMCLTREYITTTVIKTIKEKNISKRTKRRNKLN